MIPSKSNNIAQCKSMASTTESCGNIAYKDKFYDDAIKHYDEAVLWYNLIVEKCKILTMQTYYMNKRFSLLTKIELIRLEK